MKAVVERPPDLILLDIGIPAGNGLWVLEQIRKNIDTALIPVIVITGRDPLPIRAQAEALGIEAFFQKPFDNDELLRSIAEHIEQGHDAEVH
jgi:CheY-like chemotaxis protein